MAWSLLLNALIVHCTIESYLKSFLCLWKLLSFAHFGYRHITLCSSRRRVKLFSLNFAYAYTPILTNKWFPCPKRFPDFPVWLWLRLWLALRWSRSEELSKRSDGLTLEKSAYESFYLSETKYGHFKEADGFAKSLVLDEALICCFSVLLVTRIRSKENCCFDNLKQVIFKDDYECAWRRNFNMCTLNNFTSWLSTRLINC